MYDSNVTNFLVKFDVSLTQTPQYEELINLTMGYDQGEKLDTWQDLYSYLSNSVKTGLDPTWSLTVKLNKTDPVCQFILGKEYSAGAEATVKTRIINKLKGAAGKQIDFTATLSNINYTVDSETVLEISFDLKIYDATSFAETDYVA